MKFFCSLRKKKRSRKRRNRKEFSHFHDHQVVFSPKLEVDGEKRVKKRRVVCVPFGMHGCFGAKRSRNFHFDGRKVNLIRNMTRILWEFLLNEKNTSVRLVALNSNPMENICGTISMFCACLMCKCIL